MTDQTPAEVPTGWVHAINKLSTELVEFEPDLSALQAHLIQATCQMLNAETGILILIDEANHWIVRKMPGKMPPRSHTANEPHPKSEWIYQVNPRAALPEAAQAGLGIANQCLHGGRPVLANDLHNHPYGQFADQPEDTSSPGYIGPEAIRFDPSSDVLGEVAARSILCYPLYTGKRISGAIQLLNKRHGQFGVQEQQLLAMIATVAANALHGAHLLQQLKISEAELEASRWELMASHNTLRSIFDHLPAALYIVDPNFRVVAINRSRAQHCEQPQDALIGKLCYQALFNRSQPCPECRALETFSQAACTKRSERRRLAAPTRDGAAGEDIRSQGLSELEISTYPICDESGSVLQAIIFEQDVTDERHLESILNQSEKLAAIGQLAAGIAHEINNPLTAIIANAQILHRQLPANDDLQVSVDLIARAGARAAQVVRNLLDFARKSDETRPDEIGANEARPDGIYHFRLGMTDVNETVQRALDLVQHELTSRRVRLVFDPDPRLPPLLASQDHLQSVWLNLMLNAIDSIDAELGPPDSDPHQEAASPSAPSGKKSDQVRVATRQVGSEIHVSVSDNGKGIPPESLTRIFEPFYTTKSAGRGTGLGLSVSHRIIKQHGGYFRVESQVGVGSTFTAVLPLH